MSKLDQASSHPSGRWRGRFRGTLKACGMAFASLPRAALDIALPTLCVSCHEPVAGDGVCAACWDKLSFIAPPFCARLGIPFVYDPGPGLLSMQAIAFHVGDFWYVPVIPAAFVRIFSKRKELQSVFCGQCPKIMRYWRS